MNYNWNIFTKGTPPSENGHYVVILKPTTMTIGIYDINIHQWKLPNNAPEDSIVLFYIKIRDLGLDLNDPTTHVAQQLKEIQDLNASLNSPASNVSKSLPANEVTRLKRKYTKRS